MPWNLRRRKKQLSPITAAISLVNAAVTHFNQSATAAVVAATQAAADVALNSETRTSRTLYLSSGVMQSQRKSFWHCLLESEDDREFEHFLLFTRKSFFELSNLTRPIIEAQPIQTVHGLPKKHHIKRRKADCHMILAITIKHLISHGEDKDLSILFGILGPSFADYVSVGLSGILTALMYHEKSRVYWDRSIENLMRMADKTKYFLSIPGVIGMLDGKRLKTRRDEDDNVQNRNYSAWTSDHNRNMLFLWSPEGKIIDCGLNFPGNFHDSKSAVWSNVYEHIADLPTGFKVACDSAFYTRGKLSGKLVKLKKKNEFDFEDDRDGDGDGDGDKQKTHAEKEHGASLTHLRQVSEWGNGSLLKVFKRLNLPLVCSNEHRLQVQWCCVLLFNFRVDTMEINQTRTYFKNLEIEYGDDDSIASSDSSLST